MSAGPPTDLDALATRLREQLRQIDTRLAEVEREVRSHAHSLARLSDVLSRLIDPTRR